MSLSKKLRAFWLRRVVIPGLNRELRLQGIHLYRYMPDVDRLVPIRQFRFNHLNPRARGRYQSDDWFRALSDRMPQLGVAVDVGANHGYTSAWFAGWADRVIAYEANPENAELAREQIRVRGLTNVELIESAIADEEGEATLHVKPQVGHHSLGDIGASKTIGRVSVPVTTLDAECKRLGIDRIGLLKVDVEGFEPDVFRGARGLLQEKAIERILFEFSPAFYVDRGLDARAPIDLLQKFDYRFESIDGEPVDPTTLDPRTQIDLIALA